MIQPEFLQKGDTVLLLSPAGKITQEEINPAIKILEEWGLEVKIAKNSFAKQHRFAGTDTQRIADMQLALDDANIKAIICTRGGYGSIRIIDKLKFNGFIKKPKWLVGFSDITIFHCFFNSILKCETIHAPMPINLATDCTPKAQETMRKALFGEDLRYRTNPHSLNVFGKAKGELIGGNLANIVSLLGSSLAYTTKGKILFIEDVGEPIHNIDRMMQSLKFSGKLASLSGLIVGSFTEIDTEPEFGKSVMEIIHEATVPYGYPVAFNFPVGHIPNNNALYIGRKATLKVVQDGSVLMYS